MLKHKTFFLIGLLSLVAISLISCEESPDSGLSADVPAQFTCSSSPNESTRAYDEMWRTTDRVGIYMVPSNSNYDLTKALKVNYPYLPSVDGESVSLNPVGETIFYPVDGSSVNFVAYSPYLSTVTTANQAAYTFTNQGTEEAKEAVDFIFYKGKNDRSKVNAVESMTFTHKFCKINITVVQGANGPSCEDLAMQLTNVPQSATVNLATLALDETSAIALGVSTVNTTIDAYTSSSNSTNATVEAIVAPHSGTGNFTGRTFIFSAGGYSYTLPNDMTFESGKVYTFNFTLTQTAPILSETKITDWTGGTITWDSDGSMLNAPAEVTYYKEATANSAVVITTTHMAKPGIEYSTSATEITGSATVTGYLTQTAFTKTKSTSPYEWTLAYNLSENLETANREGYIHITVGTMKVVVKLVQYMANKPSGVISFLDGESNCFMVTPVSTISFSLSRPISQGTASANAAFVVEKLWDDTGGVGVSTMGSGANTYAVIQTGATPGNAMIAAKVDGEIVWSYHIWVTEYDPDNGGDTFANTNNTNNNGEHFVFMDRNLGATRAGTGAGTGTGMFYQWGRKDPFPPTPLWAFSATRVPIDENTGTIAYTIKNPHAFLYGGFSDWLYSSGSDALWGNGTTKSPYDPCPAGWRVPSHKDGIVSEENCPWKGYTAGVWSTGFTWGAGYPAGGYRHGYDSSQHELGSTGFYWSASPNGDGDNAAAGFAFYNSSILYVWPQIRNHAYSVRCVKE